MKKLHRYTNFVNEKLRETDINKLLDKGPENWTPKEKNDMDEYAITGELDDSPLDDVDYDSEGDLRINDERANPYGISDEFYDDGTPTEERELTPELEKEIEYFLEETYRREGHFIIDREREQEKKPNIIQNQLRSEFGISDLDAKGLVWDWYQKGKRR